MQREFELKLSPAYRYSNNNDNDNNNDHREKVSPNWTAQRLVGWRSNLDEKTNQAELASEPE